MKIGPNEQPLKSFRSAQLPLSNSSSLGAASPALSRDALALGTQPTTDVKNAPTSLTPDQEQQYKGLAKFLQYNGRETVFLDKLHDSGLLASKSLRDGQTLIQILDKMRTQPLAKGIEGDLLIEGLVHELADPTSIKQGSKLTCGAAAAQVILALKHPAEYARLVSDLATPAGEATLFNGATIKREDGTAGDDGSTRTPSSRLTQAAFMEYANGADEYDNASDLSGNGLTNHTGVTMFQETDLLNALDSEQFETNAALPFDISDVLGKIAATASSSNPIPVLVDYPGVGIHFVDVTAVTDDTVTYITWGETKTMPRDAFKGVLKGATLPE